jgi:tetratricopeptide (TPR) repeat protein
MKGLRRKFSVSVLVLVIGSLVTASVAETFTNRLAALQTRLQADPTNAVVLFQLGQICHHEGANNNAKAVILAEDYFKRLLTMNPNHAMARVLYGSVLTMRARDALWPTTQLSYVKTGIREMDTAVNLTPKDEQVRYARAVNNFHMPEMMGREEVVLEDLAWLWQQSQLADTKLTVGQKQTIALYYGQTLQNKNRLQEAPQVWRAGLALAPQSEDAPALKEELKKHSPKKHS